MSKIKGRSEKKCVDIIKYPKIIFVKCVETGKIYKAEKMYKTFSIIKKEHTYDTNGFFSLALNIYNNKKIASFNNTKGMFLCCNYKEDIAEEQYSYFTIIQKKDRDIDYMFNYIKDEFISKKFTIYYENNKYKDINYNYNYIRVNKKEYEEYLKNRGDNNANNNTK